MAGSEGADVRRPGRRRDRRKDPDRHDTEPGSGQAAGGVADLHRFLQVSDEYRSPVIAAERRSVSAKSNPQLHAKRGVLRAQGCEDGGPNRFRVIQSGDLRWSQEANLKRFYSYFTFAGWLRRGWRASVLVLWSIAPATPAMGQQGETAPLWSVKVAIWVSNARNAGTDDPVRVKLNDGHDTWLNSIANDFQAGSNRVYHLLLNGIRRPEDIKYLQVDKTGTDGLCIEMIRLDLNDQPVYIKDLRLDAGKFIGPGQWLDGDAAGRTLRLTDLRTHQGWRVTVTGNRLPGPPNSMSETEISRRVETAFGHVFHKGKAKWRDNSTVRVGFNSLRAGTLSTDKVIKSVHTNPPNSSSNIPRRGVIIGVEGKNNMGRNVGWFFELDFEPIGTSTAKPVRLTIHSWGRFPRYALSGADARAESVLLLTYGVQGFSAKELDTTWPELQATILSAFANFGTDGDTMLGVTAKLIGLDSGGLLFKR